MGFFSDLKDDLSQAVNELKPEEEIVPEKVEQEEFEGEISFEDDFLNKASEEVPEDIESLLDKIDAGEVAAEPVVEETFVPEEPVVKAPEISIPNRVATDEVSVIMDSMIINGNMATEGSLEIRGSVVGNVEVLGKLNITGTIQGDSSASEVFAEGAKITGEVKSMGTIKVGQSTVIIGNVTATSAVIAGAIKGDIDVKGPVILDASAIVMGDIKSKSVQINNGAVIEGMCSQCYAEVNPTSFFEELKKMR